MFSSTGKRSAIVSLLLLLATLVTYNPVVRNDFVKFDDPEYITANRQVRSGMSRETARWAFTSIEQGNWHPLTWISHALDCGLFGLNPVGHHYMSVLLHAATAILLFLFLQAATGLAWRSAMVGALFALHPVNVESVAWAAERKNVLCMFFFALLLLAYRRYAQKPEWKSYALVAALFALGLMSKPMLVTAPFILLLLDYWPLERTKSVGTWRLLLEKVPLLAMSAASSVITIIAQRGDGAIHSGDFSLPNRLANAVISYACYAGKAFWPANLASFYPHPQHVSALQLAIASVVIIGISAAVFHFRTQRYLAAGWLMFLGGLVPVIGLLQVGEQGMADRYAYLPFLGLFIAVTWAAAEWAKAKRLPAAVLAVTASCVLIAFSAVAHKQIGYWKNTRTLWTHTLSITENNYVAEASMGAELIAEGDLPGAIAHLKAGIAINPRDPFSHLDLGVCEKRMGHIPEAVAEYNAALQLAQDPSLRRAAYGNLGSIYRRSGDYARATQNFESALELEPDDLVSLTGMGLIDMKSGKAAEAANYFYRAVKAEPSDYEYLLLSKALAAAGRQPESQAALAQAQQRSKDWKTTVLQVDQLLHE